MKYLFRLSFILALCSFFQSGKTQTVTIKMDTLSGPPASVVYLPVRASNFTGIISFQGVFQWDQTKATLDTITYYKLPTLVATDFNWNLRTSGQLVIAWFDPLVGGINSAANDTLFLMKFTLIGAGGTFTPVRLIDGPGALPDIEIADNGCFCPIGYDTLQGRLNIVGGSNSISTGTISGSPFCAGASVSVPYTATGTFSGNTFTAQLSNSSGSFASPVSIGTLVSNVSGTITGTIPLGTSTGSGYRIRVISNGPSTTGTDNGVNITINAIPTTPTITAGGPLTFCMPGSVTLTSSSASGNVWSTAAVTQSISPTTSGTYTVYAIAAGCTSATSAGTVVTANATPATPTITPGSATTFCAGGSVVLTSSSSSGNIWSTLESTQSITVSTSSSIMVGVIQNGCSSGISLPVVVTVNPVPATPTISAGGSTTFCTGSSVTLNSSSSSGNLWSTTAVTNSISATTSGNYTVRVIALGCTSAVSNTIVVTANPIPPTPTISAGGPTTFCAGGNVTLTSSSALGNIWSNTTFNQTTNVSTAGSYTVLVVSAGCSSLVSAPTVVVVNAIPPAPTITPSGSTTFCTGGSVLLTSSSSSGNTWTPGSSTANSITATTANSYTVTFTNGNNCSATSAPVVVTVNPLPTVPTISAGGPLSFCTPGSVTLTSSSTGGNVWNPGATPGNSIVASSSNSYTVTFTNGNGCSATSAPTVVTASSPPAAPVISALGSTTFCTGSNVTLSSSSSSGNLWSNATNNQTTLISTSGNFTAQVVVGGCTSAVSNTIVTTANPIPPTPTITPSGPTSFCTGGNVTLSSSSALGNIWSNSTFNQTTNITTSGSYTVQVVSAGCSSLVSAPTVVTVNSIPATPTISPSGSTTFCSGSSVTLTSSSSSGNVWNDLSINNTLVASTGGSYTVRAVVGGCSSAVSTPVVVTVNATPATPTLSQSGPLTFCQGGSVTLTSSSSTGNNWSTFEVTQSINVSTSSTVLLVVIANGCTSAVSTPAVVVVNPLPATPTITPNGPTTFCTGGSVTLTSSSSTGNNWSNSDVTQSTVITTGGSYTVYAVALGCTSATSTPVVVSVNTSLPTPTITAGGPTTFCSGTNVVLTSSSSSGNNWSNSTFNQNTTITSSGSYTVYAVAGGCTSAVSAPIVVTVNSTPTTPTITPGGSTTFCAGGNVTLASSSGSGNVWTPTGAGQNNIVSTSGTYFVQVVANGCTSAVSNSVPVTVNAVPATPTISASGPTTFCAGDSVRLTSSSSSGITWFPGSQNSQSIMVYTPGSFTVSVTLNGCTSVSAATAVVVNAMPPVPTITPGGPTTFCSGNSVTLTSSSPTNNIWNPGFQVTQSINATTSGSYVVAVSQNGCTAISTPVVVTVNTTPVTPTVTPSGPTTFCGSNSVVLTSSSSSGNVWNPGGTTGQTLLVNTSGTYTTSITQNGCTATSTPIVVTVNPMPNSQWTHVANFLQLTFTDQSTGGPGTYAWNFGDTQTSTSASPSHTYASGGVYTICLIFTNGCGSDTTCSQITVNPPCTTPVAGYSFIPTNLSVAFTDTSSNAPSTWSWNFGDGFNSNLQSPTHVYSTPGTYNVCLTVINLCGTNTFCRLVTVSCPLPVPSFTQVVTGFNVNFTNGSTGGTTYTWNFGDGNVSSLQNPTHTYLAPGIYNVCLRVENSCTSSVLCRDVTILCPMPQSKFSNDVSLKKNDTFSDLTVNTPTSWSWDFGDGTFSSAQNPVHTFPGIGPYNVCLTAFNSCGNDRQCQSLSPVGLDKILEAGNLMVFPNPTTGNFSIRFSLHSSTDFEISVLNLAGQRLHFTKFNKVNGDFTHNENLSDYPAGLYFVEIQSEGKMIRKKIVKE